MIALHKLSKTMSETDNEVIDSTINESETEPELEILDEEKVEPQEDETVPKSQYNQVFARMKKAEEANKASRATPADKTPLLEKQDDIRVTVAELKMAEVKRQYGYEHSLSPEETDFVFKLSQKPTKETLDDVAIKGALQAIRAKKKINDNTPRASRSAGFTFSQSKTPLTSEEKQVIYDQKKKERLG